MVMENQNNIFMVTKNDYRKDYLPPRIEEMMTVSETVFASSDWTTAAIDDDFVDIYDL